MGDYNRKLPAGTGAEVAAKGRMIYVKTTTAPFAIKIGAETFGVQQGDRITLAEPFDGFRIEANAGADVDATLVVSSGKFEQSVIAQAVRVTNDEGKPLPVNIAGQSLPDRPYLRGGQTFMIRGDTQRAGIPALTDGSGTDVPSQKTFLLMNPADSGVVTIDPIVNVSANNGGASFSMTAFLGKAGQEFYSAFTRSDDGVNKNAQSVGASKIELYQGTTYAGYADSSGRFLDGVPLYQGNSEPDIDVTFAARHGGVMIGPGFVLALNIFDSTERTYYNAEWIEQPINA